MKNIKGFTLGLVLGLGLVVSSIGFAQNATQTDQKKETGTCCAMASCCCKGDSCSMKDPAKNHSKTHSGDGCCCCSGDSCNIKMKTKDKQKQG